MLLDLPHRKSLLGAFPVSLPIRAEIMAEALKIYVYKGRKVY